VSKRLVPRYNEVVEVYRIDRSGRRGYANLATNVGIEDADIKRLASLRAIEAAAGRASLLPVGMKESYAKIGKIIWSLLRASR
jgi:hypothetical protein